MGGGPNSSATVDLHCHGTAGGGSGPAQVVRAMADPALRPAIGTGVELVGSSTACAGRQRQQQAETAGSSACLLTLCDGTRAVLETPQVSGVSLRTGTTAALCILGPSTHVVLRGARIQGNGGAGGALLVDAGAAVVLQAGSRVRGNKGVLPAIAVAGGAELRIRDTTLSNNNFGSSGDPHRAMPPRNGAAVGIDGRGSRLYTRGTVFSNNSADEGGAIAASGGAELILGPGTDFVANEGADAAGAILLNTGTTLKADGTRFVGNSAPLSPGIHVFSATAQIDRSYFADNKASNTGVFGTFNDNAVLLVRNTTFRHNHAIWAGGVLYMQAGQATGVSSSGTAVFEDCLFINNTCSSMGGVIYSEDGHLTMRRCRVEDSVALETGGVIIARNSYTELTDSVFTNNVAVSAGGVVMAFSSLGSWLNITNCTMTGNKVELGNGGALALSGGLTWLQRSVLSGNRARQGGAISFISSCLSNANHQRGNWGTSNSTNTGSGAADHVSINGVHKPSRSRHTADNVWVCGAQSLTVDAATSIANNSAQLSGGGVQVQAWDDAQIDLAQLVAAAHGNVAQVGGEVAVSPYKLAFLGSPPNREAFVSREERSQGLLPFQAAVYGPHSTPVSGVRVAVREAVVGPHDGNGVLLHGADALSNATGAADFPLFKLRARPGRVRLRVELPDYPGVPGLEFAVTVRGCQPGEVRSEGSDACTVCGRALYSFNPDNVTCDECLDHAACPGGAQLVPLPGYWHSAPSSVQIHSCPNPAACAGATCAPGYTGPLCAQCVPGYGSRATFSCSRCLPPVAVGLLILVGHVALSLLIAWTAFAGMGPTRQRRSRRGPAGPAFGLQAVGSALEAGSALALPSKDPEACWHVCTKDGGRPNSTVVRDAAAVRDAGGSAAVDAAEAAEPLTMPLGGTPQLQWWRDPSFTAGSTASGSTGGVLASSDVASAAGSFSGSGALCEAQCGAAAAETPIAFRSDDGCAATRAGGGSCGAASQQDDAALADPSPAELLKILIRFLQYLLIVGSIHAPWPKLVSSVFQAFQSIVGASGQGIISVDCLLADRPGLPVAAQEALLQLALPALLLAGLLVAVACGWAASRAVVLTQSLQERHHRLPPWLRKQPLRQGSARAAIVDFGRMRLRAVLASAAPRLAIATLYVLFPRLVRVALSAFVCINADVPAPGTKYAANAAEVGSFWVPDVSQRCWAGWHRRWALSIGVVGTLVFCLGIPALLAAVLVRLGRTSKRGGKGASAPDAAAAGRCAMFFKGYRRRCRLWELVVTMQTEAVVAVSVLAPMAGAYVSLLALAALFSGCLALQLAARPHRHALLHHLQAVAWGILTAASLATLGLFAPGASDKASRAAVEAFSSILGVALIAAAGGFVGFAATAAAWRLRAAVKRLLAGVAARLGVWWGQQQRSRRSSTR